DARVAPLPAGVDPDDLARREGARGWAGLLAKSVSFVRFWLDHQQAGSPGAGLADQRGWIAHLAPVYRQIPDELTRQQFKQEVAGALRLGAAEVAGLLGARFARQGAVSSRARLTQEVRNKALMQGTQEIEREIIRRLFTDEEFRYTFSILGDAEWFSDPLLGEIYSQLAAGAEQSVLIHDERYAALFAGILSSEPSADDNEQLLIRHKNCFLERRVAELTAEHMSAGGTGDPERERELFHRVQELKAQIRDVRGLDATGG
ncbi:hypothetical protein IIA79_04835, partial [bacterium]|nr:hypothetical protein [bacterium]